MMDIVFAGNAPLHTVITSPYYATSKVNESYEMTNEQREARKEQMRIHNAMVRKEKSGKCVAR